MGFAFPPAVQKEDLMTRSQVVWMVAGPAGLLLIAAQALGALLGRGMPTLATPLPYVFVGLLWSGIPVVGVAVGALLVPLLAFAVGLRWGKAARILLALLYLTTAAASFRWFSGGWVYGLKYQGTLHTSGTALLSVLLAAILGSQLLLAWRRPSQNRLFAVTFLLFFWIYTYAMPYLGELP